jgi:hypothetical protein
MVNEEGLGKVFLWVFPLLVIIASMLYIDLLSGSGTEALLRFATPKDSLHNRE